MECCRVRMWVNRGLCRVSLRFPMISLWVHSSLWASLVCRRSRAPSACWRSPEDTEDKHRTDSSGNICTSNNELHEMLNRWEDLPVGTFSYIVVPLWINLKKTTSIITHLFKHWLLTYLYWLTCLILNFLSVSLSFSGLFWVSRWRLLLWNIRRKCCCTVSHHWTRQSKVQQLDVITE